MGWIDELIELVKKNPQILIILAIVAALVAASTATVTYKIVEFKIEELTKIIDQKNTVIDHLKKEIMDKNSFIELLQKNVTDLNEIIKTLQGNNSTVAIKIISPKAGDEVASPIKISGNISGELPKEQYMWAIVNPELAPGRYYPQGGRILPREGLWKDISVGLGGKQDIGTNFTIYIVLVNQTDDQNFSDCINKGNPGMPLPYSADIMDEIKVKKIQ